MQTSNEWGNCETIKMEDGRLVDFPQRIKTLTSHYTDSNTGLGYIRLDFRNGSTRTFSLHPDTVLHLAIEGADRKLRLAMAGVSDLDAAVMKVDQRGPLVVSCGNQRRQSLLVVAPYEHAVHELEAVS